MSTGLELARERMTEYLQGQGVQAVTAWPGEDRLAYPGAVAVVSVRKCQAGPSGFQDYLGERYDQDSGQWQELYGRRVSITFGLDLYAGARNGAADIQSAFDRLAQVLQQGGPDGLAVQELSCGETEYDSAGRLLCRKVEAVCSAYLYAVTQTDGAFLDFEIRGGIKQ